MKSQSHVRKKVMLCLVGFGGFWLAAVLMLAPVVLVLHLLGELLLPGWVIYGIALPLTVLFTVCLIKFPLDTKLMMTACAGGILALSLPVMKIVREKMEQRGSLKEGISTTSAAAP